MTFITLQHSGLKLYLVERLIALSVRTRTNNESSREVLQCRSLDVYWNKTGSFLSVQGVSGEAGAPGAVGSRVSFHVKASCLHFQ